MRFEDSKEDHLLGDVKLTLTLPAKGLHGAGGSIAGAREAPGQQVSGLACDPVCEGSRGSGGSIAGSREGPEQRVTSRVPPADLVMK